MKTKTKRSKAVAEKAKAVTTKVAAKAVTKAVAEKDDYGFQKGSKSSEAIKMLASGKSTGKEARKKFSTLSFGKLLSALVSHGFKVVEDRAGLCSVAGKLKA